MDHRKMLRLPDNFAYILRSGGANLRRIEFKVSYAISVGGVSAVCLIGHDDCGMVGLGKRREAFVSGLVNNAGWERSEAEKNFDTWAPSFEIDDPISFVQAEAQRLSALYPKQLVAPLFYVVGEGLLYQVTR
jgi:carbonic anhydrase